MSGPFIFIGTHKIKEGKLEDFKRYFREFCQSVVEANEPQLIAFNGYIDDDGSEVSVVQVHPDVNSMEFHMKLVHEHIESAFDEFLVPTASSIQVYGTLSDSALEMMRQLAGSGVPVSVRPNHIGGFTRSAAETLAAS